MTRMSPPGQVSCDPRYGTLSDWLVRREIPTRKARKIVRGIAAPLLPVASEPVVNEPRLAAVHGLPPNNVGCPDEVTGLLRLRRRRVAARFLSGPSKCWLNHLRANFSHWLPGGT
jgi:hypothetical protein